MATCFALVWSLAPGADARSGTPTGDQFEAVFARFNVTAPPPYRAFRRLEAGNPESKRHAWLEAWTEYRPDAGFSYTVTREGGSEYVRNKVLRSLLKSEAELIAKGKPLRAALAARNYSFADGGTTDAGMRRILLHPARKAEGIVKGSVLVDPDGHVVRLEGRLVKNLSFWLRDLDVTWKYGRYGETIVPLEMTSAGRVRLFGRSTFKMTYDYVSIGGQPVGDGLKAALRDQQ